MKKRTKSQRGENVIDTEEMDYEPDSSGSGKRDESEDEGTSGEPESEEELDEDGQETASGSDDEELTADDQAAVNMSDEVSVAGSDEELDGMDEQANETAFDPARKLEARKIAEEANEKVRKSGVVYLSSIPTGMNVAKVREILSSYGGIGRIYLEPDAKGSQKPKKNADPDKHRQKYVEGWVEFNNKKIAKRVAVSLNNTQVGGRRRTPYYECLWSIKYLNRFKWSHLTERLAHEKTTRQHRLRQEISQAKRQSNFYVQNVEKAKLLERIRKKSQAEGKSFKPLAQFVIPQRLTDAEVRLKKDRKVMITKKSQNQKKNGQPSGSAISKTVIASLFPGR